MMITFYLNVDMRSQTAMTQFLQNHFRYFTMNSWNKSKSYACNLKIYNLGLESNITDKLYDLIQTEEFFDEINTLLSEFDRAHNYRWQAKMNGRSGGYLVLYQGTVSPSEYRILVYPGRGTDDYEDFEAWDMYELRERVKLVQEFDKLADRIVAKATELAKNYVIKAEEYYIPQTRKVMVAV